jgi:hypothetical protein
VLFVGGGVLLIMVRPESSGGELNRS